VKIPDNKIADWWA